MVNDDVFEDGAYLDYYIFLQFLYNLFWISIWTGKIGKMFVAFVKIDV